MSAWAAKRWHGRRGAGWGLASRLEAIESRGFSKGLGARENFKKFEARLQGGVRLIDMFA